MPGLASAEEHREFVNATGVGAFQHVDDQSQELWSRFGVTEQRTYVLLNDDGSFQLTGYGNLQGEVENLIAQ